MNNITLATFGGGCFWCTEVLFQQLKGVKNIVVGYSGGNTSEKPSYKEVCTGQTGYAEVIQLSYDPSIISFEDLLRIHLHTHDPTSLNRQGADVGTQYRSVIFYHDENQKRVSKKVIKEEQTYFAKKIVTEITPLRIFYQAEDYHQNYYNNNNTQPYCTLVISPKLKKLKQKYSEKLKI